LNEPAFRRFAELEYENVIYMESSVVIGRTNHAGQTIRVAHSTKCSGADGVLFITHEPKHDPNRARRTAMKRFAARAASF
jgi:hypothetical protein